MSIKGGGSEIKPNADLFVNTGSENFPKYDGSSPIPATVQIEGETVQVRYHSQDLVPLTSHLGVHAYASGMADHYMSTYLEHRGLRTRSLVAAWKLGDKTRMATPEGIIFVEEFEKYTGVRPGLEIWASRCKYRVQDILRFVYEMEHFSEEKNADKKLSVIGVPRRDYDPKRGQPNHKLVENEFYTTARKKIVSELVVLSNEIKLRASQDNHKAFLELSHQFGEEITVENVGNFYIAYLLNFGHVLGEQFAVLEKNNALFGMFNLQNITLLAEIVDHDTTMIEGKVMNEEGSLVPVSTKRFKRFVNWNEERMTFEDQLFVGYDSVMSMIVALGRTGLINASEQDYEDIRQGFLKSFLSECSKKRQSLLYRYAYLKIEDVKKSDPVENHDPYSEHVRQSFLEDILALTQSVGWDESITTQEALEIQPRPVTSRDTVAAPSKTRQNLVNHYLDTLMNPETTFNDLKDDIPMLARVLAHIEKGEAYSNYAAGDILKRLKDLEIPL